MSKMSDIDIERQEIIKVAAEMGYKSKDLTELREIMEDIAGSWNGEDDQCMGTGHVGGEMISEEDAGNAEELMERIDAILPISL